MCMCVALSLKGEAKGEICAARSPSNEGLRLGANPFCIKPQAANWVRLWKIVISQRAVILETPPQSRFARQLPLKGGAKG